jgi:aminoglycoside phosphotransferase (APT) family kinase protein
MKQIVQEFYSDDCKIVSYLPQMECALGNMAPPEYTSFVLVDLDPTQFLAQNGRITGLVDTEAYVIAPRALDFIALEYVLDRRSADLISQGYEEILPIPDLTPVRQVYRYLYRLIEVQGDDDMDAWLSQPALF